MHFIMKLWCWCLPVWVVFYRCTCCKAAFTCSSCVIVSWITNNIVFLINFPFKIFAINGIFFEKDMFFLWLEIRVTMCVHIPNHAMGTIFLILLKNFAAHSCFCPRFYSLLRYSPLDGFSLVVCVFEKPLLLKFYRREVYC